MNIAQAERERKENHPHWYCTVRSCLWRTFNPRTGVTTPCLKHPERKTC
jgi:hypothetical protein